MRIYLKNIPAKFHPDPICNDGALCFLEHPNSNKKNKNNKMSSDMRSVPDPKSNAAAFPIVNFGTDLT